MEHHPADDAIRKQHAQRDAMRQKYARLFSSEDGKSVLAELMGQYHVFSPTLQPGQPPETVHFNEGARSVVLFIIGECQRAGMSAEELIEYAQLARREQIEPLRHYSQV